MGPTLRIVVDHLDGSRSGQRQEFAADQRVRFGRHPDNEVSFDATRDLDASSRHAELTLRDGQCVLRDVGSSNGTFVDGQRIDEVTLAIGTPVEVDFGGGGPRVRIVVGDDATIQALPEIRPAHAGRSWPTVVIAAGLVLIAAVSVAIWWRFGG